VAREQALPRLQLGAAGGPLQSVGREAVAARMAGTALLQSAGALVRRGRRARKPRTRRMWVMMTSWGLSRRVQCHRGSHRCAAGVLAISRQVTGLC
jgi:hypothetical protein